MRDGIQPQEYEDIGREYIALANMSLLPEQKMKFLSLKKEISAVEDGIKKINARAKGELLESMVELLFSNNQIFKIVRNKHTTSNEIDFVIKLTKWGRHYRSKEIIPLWIPDEFLIECKNYKDPVEVGLIGKFYSLIRTSKLRLGIFISNKGITGRDKPLWEDAAAFVNKANLVHSGEEQPFALIDISIEQLSKVLENDYDIVELISDRKSEIMTDINKGFINEISSHENEEWVAS